MASPLEGFWSGGTNPYSTANRVPVDFSTPNRGGGKGKGNKPRRPKKNKSVPINTEPMDKLIDKWMARSQELASVGLDDPTPIREGFMYDLNQLRTGGSTLTDPEAYSAVASIVKGKSPFKPKDEGDGGVLGFLGNALKDVENLAASIPEIPKVVLKEATALGQNVKEGKVKLTTDIHSPSEAFQNLSETPLVRMLPGVYSGKNIVQGDLGEIAKHPVYNLLDVLPIASKAGKIAAGYKLGKMEGKPYTLPDTANMTKVIRRGEPDVDINARPQGTYFEIGHRSSYGADDLTKGYVQPKNIADLTKERVGNTVGEKAFYKYGNKTDRDIVTDRSLTEISDYIRQEFPETVNNPHIDNLTRQHAAELIGAQRAKQAGFDALKGPEVKNPLHPGWKSKEELVLLNGLDNFINKADIPPPFQPASFPEGSAWSFLEQGKPFKAASQASGLAKVSTRMAEAVGVSKPIRQATAFRQITRRRPETDYLESTRQALEEQIKVADDTKVAPKPVATFRGKKPKRQRAISPKERLIKEWEKHPSVVFKKAEDALVVAKAAYSRAQRSKTAEVTGIIRGNLAKAIDDMGKARREMGRYKTAEWGKYVDDIMGEDVAEVVAQLRAQFDDGTLQKRYPTIPQGKNGRNIIKHALAKEYVKLDKFIKGFGSNDEAVIATANHLGFNPYARVVPAKFARPLQLLKHESGGKLNNQYLQAFDTATDVFKYMVLTGPRHFLHILFSNAVFSMLEQGPRPYKQFGPALRLLKGMDEWPKDLPRGIDLFKQHTADEIAATAMGKSLGRLWLEKTGLKVPHALKKAEEVVTDMYRAMIYLDEAQRTLGKSGIGKRIRTAEKTKGWEPTGIMQKEAQQFLEGPAHEAGLAAVQKTLLDIDGMSPMERIIFRRTFPFYAFTRQLGRFMLRYPSDHPTRAAIMSSIGRIEAEDLQSGLPEVFDHLFFIGGADAEGNALAIDYKFMNPFRSMDGHNPFTIAGFLSALNPYLSAPATLAGVNILNATPELYPELKVDPKTGGLKASHSDSAFAMLKAIAPQAGLIDTLFTISDDMKRLRENDPEGAYRRALMNFLNIGGVFPSEYNPGRARIKMAKAFYKTAQQDVSRAIFDEETSSLDKYDLVPFRGAAVPPEVIQQLLDMLAKGQAPNIHLKNYVPNR